MNYTNIEPNIAIEISEKLDTLLASYQIFCQKLKAFHWNIKGKNFFELHLKFEELYLDATHKFDEIAERILTLGHYPSSTFKECLKKSAIKEIEIVPSERKMIDEILLDINQLIKMEKSCLKYALENNDYATAEMLGRYIAYKEKICWMFFTWLKVDLIIK